MKLIYAQGFSKNEKLEWKPVIFSNIVQSFKTIREAMVELNIQFENPENEVSHTGRRLYPPPYGFHSDVACGLLGRDAGMRKKVKHC